MVPAFNHTFLDCAGYCPDDFYLLIKTTIDLLEICAHSSRRRNIPELSLYSQNSQDRHLSVCMDHRVRKRIREAKSKARPGKAI